MKTRFTEEQITFRILREVEAMGSQVQDVCRKVSPAPAGIGPRYPP